MTVEAPSYLGPVAYRLRTGKTPGVVFLHGYRSDMEGTKAVALDAWTQEWGCSYLRFDLRGHGLSTVDQPFSTLHLSDWLDDASKVLELTEGPQVLVGSSMGGWLALLLAKRFPDKVKAIIGVAAAPDFTRRLPDRGKMGPDGVHFGDDSFASHAFLEDGNALTLLHEPLNLSCPITLLQGKEDDVVPWQLAEAIKAQCAPDQCTIYYIQDGDHRLNRPEDLQILRTCVRFAF